MTSIHEIEQAIAQLPPAGLFALVDRLRERHADAWDRQMQADSDAGTLDLLLREVQQDIAEGRTRPADELCHDP